MDRNCQGCASVFIPLVAAPMTYFHMSGDQTKPLWFYCRQGAKTAASHCGKGMVFAVNCGPDGSANSFTNFKQSALNIGAQLQASAAAASSTPAASSTIDYTGWTTADYGSATIPAEPTGTIVTDTITAGSATWTTTYSSYPGSPDPTPSSVSPNVIKVVVGGSNGELTFSPANVTASPKDIISFELYVTFPSHSHLISAPFHDGRLTDFWSS